MFGKVGIDMIAGPSEILVLADGSCNPAWVAADLLSLGKHKQGSGKKWKNYIRQYRSRFFTEIKQRIFRLALEVLLMDMEI